MDFSRRSELVVLLFLQVKDFHVYRSPAKEILRGRLMSLFFFSIVGTFRFHISNMPWVNSQKPSFGCLIEGITKPYLVFSRCHEKHLFAHTREGDNPPTNILESKEFFVLLSRIILKIADIISKDFRAGL